MENGSKTLVTYNVRKTQRFESKKRKIEALINLLEDKSVMPPPKRKSPETLEQSYKALKNDLKNYIKKPELEPSFHLTHQGVKAQIKFKKPAAAVEPLFVEDVYQLLLRCIIGNKSPFPLSWAKLGQPHSVSKTVLLVIEGLTKADLIENAGKMANLKSFPHVVEIISSNIPFASELCALHQVTDFHIKEKDTYSTMFSKQVKIDAPPKRNPALKLHLLLSPIQMVMENYPFPQSVFQHSKSENYVFSKESYKPVTEDSPLFAIDCEMCMTANGRSELTRIAVIDENLETVYHTLVKPHNKIINYMTKFSGITRPMLEDVQTRLEDVQKHLQTILPPDAIVCGQSLSNDLHALKMIHPYVIDTSIIFNRSGIRGRKESLKNLAFTHLNKQIQMDKKNGHCPVEDAIATMKLVQLKLQNGVLYGDACLEEESGDDGVLKVEATTSPPSKEDNLNSESFFARISASSKTCCLIGCKDSLDHYNPDVLTDGLQKCVKSTRKKVLKETLKRMEETDFVVSHFAFDSPPATDSFEELDSALEQLHNHCSDRTMFMVLLSEADKDNFADIKSGLFMVALKKVKEPVIDFI